MNLSIYAASGKCQHAITWYKIISERVYLCRVSTLCCGFECIVGCMWRSQVRGPPVDILDYFHFRSGMIYAPTEDFNDIVICVTYGAFPYVYTSLLQKRKQNQVVKFMLKIFLSLRWKT